MIRAFDDSSFLRLLDLEPLLASVFLLGASQQKHRIGTLSKGKDRIVRWKDSYSSLATRSKSEGVSNCRGFRLQLLYSDLFELGLKLYGGEVWDE